MGHKLCGGAKSLAGRVAKQVCVSSFRNRATGFFILHHLSVACGEEGKHKELNCTNPSTFHVLVELVVFRHGFEDVLLSCVGLG